MTRLITKTKITNPNINSGTAINLQAASINEKQSAFSKVYDSPNGAAVPDYLNQLNGFSNTGFSNSVYQIKGHYNLKEDHATGALAVFDREYKNQFMTYAYTNFILYDNLFITSTNAVGSVNVCITDITFQRSNDSVQGHFIDYTISCVEVIE